MGRELLRRGLEGLHGEALLLRHKLWLEATLLLRHKLWLEAALLLKLLDLLWRQLLRRGDAEALSQRLPQELWLGQEDRLLGRKCRLLSERRLLSKEWLLSKRWLGLSTMRLVLLFLWILTKQRLLLGSFLAKLRRTLVKLWPPLVKLRANSWPSKS